ncbi:MAG: hypothetical protein KHX29_04865 [Prevotella buccalis]|nr:hypothetical protein [Hoylesella buccalis]
MGRSIIFTDLSDDNNGCFTMKHPLFSSSFTHKANGWYAENQPTGVTFNGD